MFPAEKIQRGYVTKRPLRLHGRDFPGLSVSNLTPSVIPAGRCCARVILSNHYYFKNNITCMKYSKAFIVRIVYLLGNKLYLIY